MLNLYAVVLTLIVAALLAVSLAQIRKVHTKADYLVAGRSLPAYVLVFTLLSSWIGAGSLFAGAENAFHNGFAASGEPAGGWAGTAHHLLCCAARPQVRAVHHSRPAGGPLQHGGTHPGNNRDSLRLHGHHQLPVSAPAETSCT